MEQRVMMTCRGVWSRFDAGSVNGAPPKNAREKNLFTITNNNTISCDPKKAKHQIITMMLLITMSLEPNHDNKKNATILIAMTIFYC